MDEEIMKAIEQVASTATQGQDRMDKEAFIDSVAHHINSWTSHCLVEARDKVPSIEGQRKMQEWYLLHGNAFAYQMSQVAKVLLRKELLGE